MNSHSHVNFASPDQPSERASHGTLGARTSLGTPLEPRFMRNWRSPTRNSAATQVWHTR